MGSKKSYRLSHIDFGIQKLALSSEVTEIPSISNHMRSNNFGLIITAEVSTRQQYKKYDYILAAGWHWDAQGLKLDTNSIKGGFVLNEKNYTSDKLLNTSLFLYICLLEQNASK